MKPPHKPGYRVEEWEDETSMFDPRGRWQGGSECYFATYRCYVPIRLRPENVSDWIDRHQDELVWIRDDGTCRTRFDNEEIKATDEKDSDATAAK